MVSRTYRWRGWAVLSVLVVGATHVSGIARAELPTDLEPDYAAAVLAYNSQDYNKALALLNELQKKAPKGVEILELKAITLKATKQEGEAANVYRDLVQLKVKQGNDKKEIAPYSFELGILRYNEKKYQQAEQYFQYAARNEFNVDISNFYLGLISVQMQDWNKADERFELVLKTEIEEIRAATHFYLAQTKFKKEAPAQGFDHLIKAKRTAQSYIARPDVQPESKEMATQVMNAAQAALAPYDKTQFFGSFSFLTGYDTNVLLVPSETSGSQDISGKSTLKSTLSVGAGYASSPLEEFQYVPSARFNINKNYNKDSSSGEFSDSTLSLYVTRNVLSPVAYGLKTEGSIVFQNDYNASTDSSKYRLYNTGLQFAPYVKWEAMKKWAFSGEFGVKFANFNGEEDVQESLRRSGNVYHLKISGQNKAGRKYYNPNYVLKFEMNDTEGTEFASMAYGAQVTNTMFVKKIELTQVFDFTRTGFGDSTTDRSDTNFTLSLIGSKKIGPRWAVMATADYTRNISSEEQAYQYSRFTMTAGVGYTF